MLRQQGLYFENLNLYFAAYRKHKINSCKCIIKVSYFTSNQRGPSTILKKFQLLKFFTCSADYCTVYPFRWKRIRVGARRTYGTVGKLGRSYSLNLGSFTLSAPLFPP
jgi:hypothetical protein